MKYTNKCDYKKSFCPIQLNAVYDHHSKSNNIPLCNLFENL